MHRMLPSMTIERTDLDTFPVVSDFAVRLTDARDDGGRHIELVSASRGRLAGFPAWDHADRDLRHFVPSDVPLGTFDDPYDDRDEGWRILIFEEGGWVYVAEGAEPDAETFESVFRVRRERYFQAWAALIDRFNPITPLDDVDPPRHDAGGH